MDNHTRDYCGGRDPEHIAAIYPREPQGQGPRNFENQRYNQGPTQARQQGGRNEEGNWYQGRSNFGVNHSGNQGFNQGFNRGYQGGGRGNFNNTHGGYGYDQGAYVPPNARGPPIVTFPKEAPPPPQNAPLLKGNTEPTQDPTALILQQMQQLQVQLQQQAQQTQQQIQQQLQQQAKQFNEKFEAQEARARMLETQIAQLAQERASISGNAVQNPAHDHYSVNSVVLRSGTTLKEPKGKDREEASPTKGNSLGDQIEHEVENEGGDEVGKGDEVDKEASKRVEKGKEKQVESEARPYRPPMPYPYAWAERKMSDKFKKFLEMMKTLQVNVPFLQAMTQMPLYAKFLKDLLTNKSRLEEAEVITLPYQVSALIQGTLPKKESDPGSFTLPVRIGNLEPLGGLADLGAGPNLMPLSVAKRLPYEL